MLNTDQLAKVTECLEIWAHGQKSDSAGLGYPKKSSVFATGGINCWDDQESESETYTYSTMEKIIQDLPDDQRAAINITYNLATFNSYKFQHQTYADALTNAYQSIWAELTKWGLA